MTFKEYSFRELLMNIVDNRGRTCPTSEHGIPLIATNCIKNSGLYPVYEKLRYVSEETYQTWFRGHPEPGDMIFVCKGSPGRVCWTPDPVPFCIAQDMVAIRADTTKVYPKYLFALLRSEAVQHQILNMHVGTLIPHFKKGDFANLYLQIPEDMEYQRRVGDAYFSFCESIEKNHQINQTLEQMAQAIFKSWFVDFEPVKAKIAALEAGGSEEDALRAAMQAISGKGESEITRLQAEQPEQYAELRATAELFPSAMQDSELGEIPEGWNIASIGDLCSVRKGLSYKGTHLTNDPKDAALVNLGNFAGGGAFRSEKLKYYDGEFKLRHLVSPGQLMVANTDMTQNRVILGSPLIVPSFAQDEIIFTHHTFAVDFKQEYPEQRWKHFIYHWCLQPSFRARAEGFATGTTVLALPKDAFLRCDIVLTTGDLVDAFNSFAVDAFTQREKLIAQNETLEHLREALLPKLLSGEISISTAEDQLAEAAEPTNV